MVKEGSVCAHPLCSHHLHSCHTLHTAHGGASQECPPGKKKIAPPNVFKHQTHCGAHGTFDTGEKLEETKWNETKYKYHWLCITPV